MNLPDVIIYPTGDDTVWFGNENKLHSLDKKIKMEIKESKKKVTVTTKENGEEKTEVYEGEEAEEYLENMKSEGENEMIFEFDDDGNQTKTQKIIIEKKVTKDKSDK